jgi:hypothetical protein
MRYAGTARLVSRAAPPSAALPGANDLLAARSFVLPATDQGIYRSADDGVTWQPVLSGFIAGSLTAAPTGGFAAAGNLPGANGAGSAVLATSADGLHWRLIRISAPIPATSIALYGYRIVLSGLGPSAVGIAVPDALWTFFSAPSLRSTDGGRTWSRITSAGSAALPGAAGSGVALLPDGRTVFVTAAGPGGRCAGVVYASSDAGATWTLLPGSCAPFALQAVQFLSARQGFAAGGQAVKDPVNRARRDPPVTVRRRSAEQLSLQPALAPGPASSATPRDSPPPTAILPE